jgi:hypothetical protein
MWQWLLIAVVLLVAVGMIGRSLTFRRAQQRLRDSFAEQDRPVTSHPVASAERTAPLLESPTRTVPATVNPVATITSVSLASAQPDYRFDFSATVHWRPVPGFVGLPHGNPVALATNAVIGRAYEITATEHPADHEVVQHKLNAALGTMQPERTGQVEAWAVRVSLVLSPPDQERLLKLADVRKDEELWERERNHEQRKRAYLTQDVLASPGSAVVWWLARDFGQVRETVALIGTLAQLSAAANNTEVPELFRSLIESGAVPPSLSTAFDPLVLQGPIGRAATNGTNGSLDNGSWPPPTDRPAAAG